MFEPRTEDVEEESTLMGFKCHCVQGPKRTPCSESIPLHLKRKNREFCLELNGTELDMLILGQLSSHKRKKDLTHLYPKAHMATQEDISDSSDFTTKMNYHFADVRVCTDTFCFIHTISRRRLRNLQHHFDNYGLSPRRHGNSGKVTSRAITPDTMQAIVDFLKRIADARALPLPGRMANERDMTSLKLPSDMTKVSLYREYVRWAEQQDTGHVGLTTFQAVWKKYVPEITIMKPAQDVCLECQKNNDLIAKSSPFSQEIQDARKRTAEEHLSAAAKQRESYNEQCKLSKVNINDSPPSAMAYSFDYAQNIFLPSNPIQPGPAFFKTPRKCGVFGVLCEGSNTQTTYLIDEEDFPWKGANSVVSMVHAYLEEYGLGENELLLNADNACGQNKNNTMLYYMLWRVATGRHQNVKLSFMMPGHTKFAPDRSFGMFKKVYNRTLIDTWDDLQECVRKSSPAGLNIPALTYDPVRKVRKVTWYDWTSYLSEFYKPLHGILQYQNFRTTEDPGVIAAKERVDKEECFFNLLKDHPPPAEPMPLVITPIGLDLKRQWYLHEQISQLCSNTAAASLICPKPEIPKPSSKQIPIPAISDASRTKQASGPTKRTAGQSARVRGAKSSSSKRRCPRSKPEP